MSSEKSQACFTLEIKVGIGGGGKKENKESLNLNNSDKGLCFFSLFLLRLLFFIFHSVVQNHLHQNHLEVKIHLWGWNRGIFMNSPDDPNAY